MSDKTVGPSSAQRLPSELYREIAANLHDPSNRPALLSLSLVNTTWRTESQRVLFRSLCDKYKSDDKWWREKKRLRDTHVGFLRAIVAHPTRLGSFVRSYAQIGLVSNIINDPSERGDTGNCELWELTLRALPMFTNLKQLAFVPQIGSMTFEAAVALSRCTFQLVYLSWGCEFGRQLEQFLLTSGSLIEHLDMGSALGDLRPLPPSAAAVKYLSMDRYSPPSNLFKPGSTGTIDVVYRDDAGIIRPNEPPNACPP
ncbi:hypothetical protein D9619_012485 [Psilocybe cf. subviscida]|uniref:F-box domain-containing protein n=1 Tax=Psilocybe cf. subviscida TaxID=2480587 RepID=A0A8H5ASD0_9AGAR|nr:hypothetical protein D9619_012485 [Psilocybe cf. subviscida]